MLLSHPHPLKECQKWGIGCATLGPSRNLTVKKNVVVISRDVEEGRMQYVTVQNSLQFKKKKKEVPGRDICGF